MEDFESITIMHTEKEIELVEEAYVYVTSKDSHQKEVSVKFFFKMVNSFIER